jgi:hypothetical protein
MFLFTPRQSIAITTAQGVRAVVITVTGADPVVVIVADG